MIDNNYERYDVEKRIYNDQMRTYHAAMRQYDRDMVEYDRQVKEVQERKETELSAIQDKKAGIAKAVAKGTISPSEHSGQLSALQAKQASLGGAAPTEGERIIMQTKKEADKNKWEYVKTKWRKYVKPKWRKFEENWFDRYAPVRRFYDALRKKGIEIADKDDYYMQVLALDRINQQQGDDFINNQYAALNQAMADIINGISLTARDLENYAILKHGMERNSYLNHKKATKDKDYSGIQAVLKEYKDGDRTPFAGEVVAKYEKQIGKELVDRFWQAVNAATAYSIDKQYEGGIISAKKRDYIKGMYKYYIPLRGVDEETAADKYDYEIDFNALYLDYKQDVTEGHVKRSTAPFEYMILYSARMLIGFKLYNYRFLLRQ